MNLSAFEREFPNFTLTDGPNVWYFYDDFNDGLDASATSGAGKWTLLETAAGATQLLDLAQPGGVLTITQAANDNDVVSLIANSDIKVDSIKPGSTLFFGCRFKTEDADDVDLHIGLGIHDTSYTASEPADYCCFKLVEGSASLVLTARKDGVSTTVSSTGTVADGTFVRAFFAYTPSTTTDIGTLEYVVHSHGTRTTGTVDAAGNFPDDVVIFPVIQVQNGAAAADVSSIDWVCAFAQRADYTDGTG